MHSPVRSESDVFNWVVAIVVGTLAAVVLGVLTEPEYGGILAAGLLGVGIGLVWHGARGSLPGSMRVASGEGAHRILVVANETVGGEALLGEIRNRSSGRGNAEVLVVSPALTRSRLQYLASDTDAARSEAGRRLRRSLETIRAAGLRADGAVGDEDPVVAVEDALRAYGADELIVSTHPPERSRWLERGVIEQLRHRFELPLTHVVVEGAGPRAGEASEHPERYANRP